MTIRIPSNSVLTSVSRRNTQNVITRDFHVSASALTRLRRNIKLRPPIVPSVSSIQVKDDHPLWQFFSDKKFIRSSEDLEQVGM